MTRRGYLSFLRLASGSVALAALAGCVSDAQPKGSLDPTAAIATVVINPGSINIAPNTVVQFDAYGLTMAGDSVSVVLDWEADGGSVGPNGTFSSADAGTYRVIGHSPMFPFPGDTVMVTVSVAPIGLSRILITPYAPIIAPGGTRPFLVDGVYSDSSVGPVTVSWSATGGTIDPNGFYTAGSTEGPFWVTASSGGVSDSALVTINALAPTVSYLLLTPDTVILRPGASAQLQAYGLLTDGTISPVTANYTATSGTITSTGYYTAGAVPGTYSAIALSPGDGNADTATVIISSSAIDHIVLTPPSVALQFGSSVQFAASAVLSDGSSAAVSVAFTATGGTIGAGGLYTAGNVSGTYQVVATNAASGLADTASVAVTAPASALDRIEVEPSSLTLLVGGSQQFSATGVLTDGSLTPVPVTWFATGGTISPAGSYTAPTVAGSYRVIARAVIGGKADTALVTVNAANTLAGVSVSPGSAQILTGAIQQFSAVGTLSGGGTTAVNVTWSATGGTVSSSGTYTASQTPGTYKVIAKASTGGFADTATVTVITLPAPGSTACTYEPSGYTTISNQPFSAKPPNAPATDNFGWSVRQSDGFRLTISSDATAPKSASSVFQGVFPQGFGGGAAPFKAALNFSKNYKELYVCLFTKLDPLWTNNGNAATKFGFFTTPYTSGSTAINHYFNLTNNLGIQLQSSGAVLNRNMLSSFSLIGHRGLWHKVEFQVIGNSLGKSDGVARMWVNGAEVLNVTNVQYFYPSQTPAFDGITWNPTYGGGHNPVPYDMKQWVDHWYISGR